MDLCDYSFLKMRAEGYDKPKPLSMEEFVDSPHKGRLLGMVGNPCEHTHNITRDEKTMVKCPRCGKEASDTLKEWDYAAFHVKLLNCAMCKKTFKAYFRKGKLSHTVPQVRPYAYLLR